jgi:hypothetical protein
MCLQICVFYYGILKTISKCQNNAKYSFNQSFTILWWKKSEHFIKLFLIIAISVIAFEFNEDSGILPATYGGGGVCYSLRLKELSTSLSTWQVKSSGVFDWVKESSRQGAFGGFAAKRVNNSSHTLVVFMVEIQNVKHILHVAEYT